jgi:hypothetical protein
MRWPESLFMQGVTQQLGPNNPARRGSASPTSGTKKSQGDPSRFRAQGRPLPLRLREGRMEPTRHVGAGPLPPHGHGPRLHPRRAALRPGRLGLQRSARERERLRAPPPAPTTPRGLTRTHPSLGSSSRVLRAGLRAGGGAAAAATTAAGAA